MKKLLKPVIFLAVGVVIFLGIQDFFVIKDLGGGTPEKAIKGYFALEEDSIDVLIFGASHPEFGISPMRLYENKGISSYNLATGNQPIECSYYMLKEALKTQTPKIVLLDPAGLFLDESAQKNSAWRLVLDHLPIDKVKLEMAADYGERSFGDGYWSAFIPIIKYHTRWNQLGKKDFMPHWKGMYYTAGELLVSYISPTTTTIDDIEYNLNEMRARNLGFVSEFDGESRTSGSITEEMFYSFISEEKREYFLKIKELCEECGAEMILVTIPTIQLPWAHGTWNSERSRLMKEFAASEGVQYIDLVCDYDLVDYTTDTFDAGVHLNCRGAGKITNFLGNYLQTKITQTKNNDLYDAMLGKYHKVLDIAMLESEKDFYTYIKNLAYHLNNCIVFISVDDEYTFQMTEDDYTFLQDRLGLQIVREGGYTDAYIAVIDEGKLLYEALSNRRIEYEMQIDDLTINMVSSGWFNKHDTAIEINGNDYAQGGRGLNIVVYDKEYEMVVDSVSFDTHQASKAATRNWAEVDTYLRAYESAVCF